MADMRRFIFVTAAMLAQTGALARAASSCLPPLADAGANYTAIYKSLGCYVDANNRTLDGPQLGYSQTNSARTCANVCGLGGYTYAATEYTSQCFCGNAIVANGPSANASACTYVCPGAANETCGGTWLMNLYEISNPSPNPIPPVSTVMPDCTRDPLCSNPICDASLPWPERVAGLISNMTLQEKAGNMMNGAAGVSRLGLPPYQWWSEALHGVASSPGVSFGSPNGTNFSYATSFPMPITMGAAFDDDLINKVAHVVGIEGRSFANNARAGFDFWTPNINPFRDPRWGRGLEVAGEDPYRLSQYVYSLVTGLQGGLEPEVKTVISTCKHYAVYDVEENRNGDDLDPTAQDLSEYYLPPFKSCARDAKVGAVMCSYNAEYGVPSCADRYLLQEVLRESWNWSQPYNWITSDCSAVTNIESPHNYVSSDAAAAGVALNAGTDLACEDSIYNSLVQAVAQNITTEATIDKSLARLYTSLIQVGYFTPPASLAALGWKDVNTPSAQQLAWLAAAEGITLLKNDHGTLPLPKTLAHVAVIGPWAQATMQMQGNYQGTAPYLISPLQALNATWGTVTFAQGTDINSTDSSGFAAALAAAKTADVIIYCGGIDTSIEAEGLDRDGIAWPGNQLDLVGQLAALGKKLVVVQFGGGQIDDSTLLANKGVNAIIWAGYPGQSGGNAVRDAIVGIYPPAGRLPVTQYPADYINKVSKFDPGLRPNTTTGNPGRTYMWYPTPILPMGYGLHYTNFSVSITGKPNGQTAIGSLISKCRHATYPATLPFSSVGITVTNKGTLASDYVALLFLRTSNAGPAPYPLKTLVSYARAKAIAPGASAQLELKLTLANLARADAAGNFYLYPGDYSLAVDVDDRAVVNFTLTGQPTLLETLPSVSGVRGSVAISYLGCFDAAAISGGPSASLGKSNAPQACANKCAAAGYSFSGIQGQTCLCGSKFAGVSPASDASCNTACPGDQFEFCGGATMYNVYNATPPVHPEPPSYVAP